MPAQTAAELLKLPPEHPELLFTGHAMKDRDLLRGLRARWHPDMNPDNRSEAEAVFQHVNQLYDELQRQVTEGSWRGPGQAELALRDGTALRINFFRRRKFDLGTVSILSKGVIYASDGTTTSQELFANATKRIRALSYADDKMQKEFERYMPSIETQWPLLGNGSAFLVRKTPELICLRDLLDVAGGRLDPRHVAWVLTRLHSILCYLQTQHVTHNAIDLDSCFICPPHHTVCLLGGWFFARTHGEPVQFLPARSAQVWRELPREVTRAKTARHWLDRACVRLLARELLGDPGGTKLLHDKTVPNALAQWVCALPNNNGFKDFSQWEQARDRAFGPRKFVDLAISAEQIYAPAGA